MVYLLHHQYIFWWDMFLTHQFSSDFFLLINSISLSFRSQISSHVPSCFQIYCFLFFLDPPMLVTVNKLKHMAWATCDSSNNYWNISFFEEFFFSVSHEISLVMVTNILTNNLEKDKWKLLISLYRSPEQKEKKYIGNCKTFCITQKQKNTRVMFRHQNNIINSLSWCFSI